ncbi:hypothetical protein BH24GEM3_BH24GEM3_06280 [soil metagenome]
MNTSKFALAAAAVAALGLGTASEGLAQACIGTPTLNGQRAVTIGAGFPEWGTNYNARLDVNTNGPLSARAGFTHSSASGTAPNVNTGAVGVAYNLPVSAGRQVEFSACPTLGVQYGMSSTATTDQSQLVVPVGVGLGARVNLGGGMALTPYVLPEFYVNRVTLRGDNAQRQVSDDTGLRATVGTALDFGPFFAGVDYISHYQADPRNFQVDVPLLDRGMGSALGVRVGVKF